MDWVVLALRLALTLGGWRTVATLMTDFEQILSIDGSKILTMKPNNTVPRIVHFTIGNVELAPYHYLSVRAAHETLQAEEIMIWLPSTDVAGVWWRRVKRIPTVKLMVVDTPTHVFGNEVKETAHIADIIRMAALWEYGGIYIDFDVIAFRSFDPFLSMEATAIPKQGDYGLCNAVIISQPRAPFLRRWMEEYRYFQDSEWSVLSVDRPRELAESGVPNITMLPEEQFFLPSWEMFHNHLIHIGKSWDTSNNTAVHLWVRFIAPLHAV